MLGQHGFPIYSSLRLLINLLLPPQPRLFYMSTSTLQSHISVLVSSAGLYPTRPAFKIPVVNKETSQIAEWSTVTYAQFLQDVELYARNWTSVLSAGGVTPGSIVGLWCVSYFVRVNDPRILTLHPIKAWWRSIH